MKTRLPTALILTAVTSAWATSPLIVNEYNAVSDTQFLSTSASEPWKGYDYGVFMSLTQSAGAPRAGRIKGNGGNWIELVVVQDHLDMRNWSLEWSNADPPPDNAGAILISNDPIWSNLRAGTIITIIEDGHFEPEFADGSTLGYELDLSTNTSFNPQNNDWWMHFELSQANTTYLSTSGAFKVDHDNWQITIRNAQQQIVFGPVGEAVLGWGGGGLNSQEVAVNIADPDQQTLFDDNDYSTFGAPNRYSQNTQEQDFSLLRTWWINRLAGDADCDGDVDNADFGAFFSHFGMSSGATWFEGDFDTDGDVDNADFGIFFSHFGSTAATIPPQTQPLLTATSVPEPASIVTLLLAATTLLGRRHKKK